MKKINLLSATLFVFFLLIFPHSSNAQWATSGDRIYNTNTGNIAIGEGINFNAIEKVHVRHSLGANLLLESQYSGTANRTMGAFRITNPASAGGSDHQFIMALRRHDGQYDLVQSVFVAGFGWAEFSRFFFSTRNYHIRHGVNNFLINNSGVVGIGVPENDLGKLSGAKLGVNGKIIAEAVEVKLYSGWPDFVFCDNYDLMSISDLENYINDNRRLPNVPSESEVREKGINLGEMSSILLQKIEELTLYILELNKQNEELTVRLNNLEK